jgi:hypothetical protein
MTGSKNVQVDMGRNRTFRFSRGEPFHKSIDEKKKKKKTATENRT